MPCPTLCHVLLGAPTHPGRAHPSSGRPPIQRAPTHPEGAHPSRGRPSLLVEHGEGACKGPGGRVSQVGSSDTLPIRCPFYLPHPRLPRCFSRASGLIYHGIILIHTNNLPCYNPTHQLNSGFTLLPVNSGI